MVPGHWFPFSRPDQPRRSAGRLTRARIGHDQPLAAVNSSGQLEGGGTLRWCFHSKEPSNTSPGEDFTPRRGRSCRSSLRSALCA
jgi:hypothetical protein